MSKLKNNDKFLNEGSEHETEDVQLFEDTFKNSLLQESNIQLMKDSSDSLLNEIRKQKNALA
jgi:hypothetical protein